MNYNINDFWFIFMQLLTNHKFCFMVYQNANAAVIKIKNSFMQWSN